VTETDHAVDICIIEDDGAQRALIRRQLEPHGYSIVEAGDGPEGLRAIYKHRPRVLICDLMLPTLSGLQICRHVRADPTLDGTFILVVTAHGDGAQKKKKTLLAGADDFLHKPYDPDELLARIRNGLRFHRLQERLRTAALTDGLTDLWNHMHFRDLLEREFQRTRRYGGEVSLLMIDLDNFKAINDTYGHEVGNSVLRLTARHLERISRDSDIVARYGGEEFSIICPSTPVDEAAQLAERIRCSLPVSVRLKDYPELCVHASIGVVSSTDGHVASVAELINQSDRALYHSKRTGRNRVTVAQEIRSDTPVDEVRVTEVERLRKEVLTLSMRAKDYCLQSVWALIQALEARDGYSAWHSRNVTLYTKWLAEAADWPKPLRVATTNAAMLHDLGKIGLPDELLLTPRTLVPAEAALIRQVPQMTCKILAPLRVFDTEMLIIRHLRERWDGGGYPDGLHGNSVPIGSRLLAITEAFDSITCNRAFRPGKSIDEALAVIEAEVGAQFDPEFVAMLRASVESDRGRWQAQIDRARVELPTVIATRAHSLTKATS
jgi:diguanylate cyclase (GGDEF)-like protein